jgi:hypothetical protein
MKKFTRTVFPILLIMMLLLSACAQRPRRPRLPRPMDRRPKRLLKYLVVRLVSVLLVSMACPLRCGVHSPVAMEMK